MGCKCKQFSNVVYLFLNHNVLQIKSCSLLQFIYSRAGDTTHALQKGEGGIKMALHKEDPDKCIQDLLQNDIGLDTWGMGGQGE